MPDDAVFGKYRLIAELGQGGMADVFLAVAAGPEGSGFSKLTVIKRLRRNLADDPEFIAMLMDEARIAARLNHPNVVQTNEVGNVDREYFIAMEYLDGQPLHRIQHRSQKADKDGGPRVSREQQYAVLVDVLAGLHHAHELTDYDGTPLHVVHRDVTPHNIFVTYEGQTKVVDFGVAKAVGRASETRQGVVKGKVRYMAPEQAIGEAVDRRADLFSVGVLLWEIATGKRMWQGIEDLAIVHALACDEIPRSPRAVNPEVPEAIDAMCVKALANDPRKRFQTANEFRLALEQYLAETGLLVAARRDLGPVLTDIFKEQRKSLKAIIEKQLSALTARPSAKFLAVPSVSDAPRSVTPSGTLPLTVNVEAQPTAAADEGPTEVYAKGRGVARSFAMLLGVGAILAIGGWAVAHRASPPASLTDTTAAAAAPKPDDVHVVISAEPESASIFVDDKQVANPYVARVRRSEEPHRVRVVAKGYETRERTLRFAADVNETIELEATKADPRVGVASRSPSSPPRHSAPKPSPVAAPTPDPPAANPTPAPDPVPTRTPPNRPRREIDKNDPWAIPSP